MLRNLYYLLFSKHPNLVLLKLLLWITIVYVIVHIYNKYNGPVKPEGFSNVEPFVIKTDDDMYDDFTISMYEILHNHTIRNDKELIEIIHLTNPSNDSIFLEIGCGSGKGVYELQEADYNVFGLERSQALIQHGIKKSPDIEISCGDGYDPMTYEKGTFTHVLCRYFTIYDYEDKSKLFRNCYFWMKPGGYLVVHLVDTDHFTKVVACSDANVKTEVRPQNNRLLTTTVDLGDYTYMNKLAIENNTIMEETFTNKETKTVRQHDNKMFIETINDIVSYAQNSGFVLHSYVSINKCINDNYQYFYVFERTM